MSGAAFLRIKKLKGGSTTLSAARHNRRDIQRECGASASIDPTRSRLNETLIGLPTAADVALSAKNKLRMAGITKLRKDAVMALEFVFSLPANCGFADTPYFQDCVDWTAANFGGIENILSADIHRDESKPHCHILLLPLLKGRMVGSDLMGNRRTLAAHHASFQQAVGLKYGLKAAPAKLVGQTKAHCVTAVLHHLKNSRDPALKSLIWPEIRESIERDPGPAMASLGIEIATPRRKLKTMTEIFTSPGKGAKSEHNPIGFGLASTHQNLCSVGFAETSPSEVSA